MVSRGTRIKKIFDNLLGNPKGGFARTDITYLVDTDVKDSMGNVESTTQVSTTITGDFQTVTASNILVNEIGRVNVGDARLFVVASSNLVERAFVVVDSIRWQLKARLEPDEVNGVKVAESWHLIRFDG